MNPADDASPHGTDMVVRRGKIFECGEFKDKNFSMSPEELRSAVDQFSGPLQLDLEHVPTVLDGKLGRLDSVWLSEDGRELHGSVAMPRWLDDLLADGQRKVSATWSRATKGLEKLALVRNPRVKDAVIFAAFSEADPDGFVAAFTDRKKHDHTTAAHQAIHDVIRMGYPGVCAGGPMKPPGGVGDMVGMSEADAAYFSDHPLQLKSLRKMHSMCVENGARCSGSGSSAKMSDTSTRGKTMSTAADSVAFADSPEYLALRAELDAEKAKNAETAAKLAETTAQFSATQAELETARIKQVAQDAKAFALAEITAGRSTSNEYQDLVADFTDASNADHASKELVTFSDATGAQVKGSRVDKLRAREAKRQSHGLFTPGLGDGKLVLDGERILMNDNGQDSAASDRAAADAVLAKFNDGQAVLNRRKAAK